jgi:hypothetical protein
MSGPARFCVHCGAPHHSEQQACYQCYTPIAGSGGRSWQPRLMLAMLIPGGIALIVLLGLIAAPSERQTAELPTDRPVVALEPKPSALTVAPTAVDAPPTVVVLPEPTIAPEPTLLEKLKKKREGLYLVFAIKRERARLLAREALRMSTDPLVFADEKKDLMERMDKAESELGDVASRINALNEQISQAESATAKHDNDGPIAPAEAGAGLADPYAELEQGCKESLSRNFQASRKLPTETAKSYCSCINQRAKVGQTIATAESSCAEWITATAKQ